MVNKMNFPTQYDKHERVYSNPGTTIGYEKALAVDENGHEYVKIVSEYSIPDDINSHADSVDIHVIMKQFEQGNLDVINRKHGIFTDITQMPKTFAEMYEKVVDGEQYFNSLPVELRDKFNQNFGEFISSIGTDKFNNAFADFSAEKNAVNGSAVTEQQEVVKEGDK